MPSDLGLVEVRGVELARPLHDPDAHLRGTVRARTIGATMETRYDDARTRGVARAADPLARAERVAPEPWPRTGRTDRSPT